MAKQIRHKKNNGNKKSKEQKQIKAIRKMDKIVVKVDKFTFANARNIKLYFATIHGIIRAKGKDYFIPIEVFDEVPQSLLDDFYYTVKIYRKSPVDDAWLSFKQNDLESFLRPLEANV